MKIGKGLLLVVDVQQGFINQTTKPVVSKISGLIAEWEAAEWPVILSRFINLPNSNWERLRQWPEMKAEPDTLLAEELEFKTPYIFKKGTYSAWSSEVLSVCQNYSVRDVYIAGIDTNECVLATALAIFDAGFTPWIVEDCCASSGGDDPHDMTLTLLKPLLGEQQIITSKELL